MDDPSPPNLTAIRPAGGNANPLSLCSLLAEADDARLHTLLDFLGDLPLAVSIVAGMLHFESADELLVRWQTERTGMIDMGEHTKLSSLNLSIQISLHSHRMRAFPSAELLLMAISLYPDGIVDTEDGIAFLKPALPRLRQHLSVLKQASLAYTNSVGRICVLPPIREFMLRRQDLPDAFIQALVEFCLGFSVPLQDYVRDAPELHAVMLPEMQNMQSVMGFLFEAQREEAVPVLSIIRAFDLYGTGRGMDNEPLLQHALVLARSLNRVDASYGDKVREASAHFNAAAAWILSESPVEARRHLESALSVVEDEEPTDEVISLRAYTCRFLAEVHNTHFDRDGLAVAVDYMRRAQDLYTQLRHESGLNSCYIFLAQCALERCGYKESEQTAQNVLKYALQTQNIIHEAAATSVLAETASRRGDYTAAISFIQRYSKIFWQVGNMAPFIWALKTEATFEMERNRLERAEEILKTAFKEVKRHGMEDSLPATQCYKMRGTLRAKQGEFLAACADLGQAILMARRMTIESSEEAYCLTEMAKLLNLHGDGQAALIPAISAMASFRKNGDLSSLLDCMLELGVSFALGRDGKSAWNCWSVALDCHLRSGAAHDAGVCLLSMVKLQATTPIEFLPTVVNRIPASQRLNAAFALFEANKDEAGLQRSIELARTLGLPDPPDDLP
ncbi:hypothetical protein BKA62DRAFT_806110 [Auriculariales sp. MPI-PUGE-AT-0066]|nr:hypothetical protein BKA62DRAFT_806110 [Auriculariales sp. MPI-PUGE-AT-0066]